MKNDFFITAIISFFIISNNSFAITEQKIKQISTLLPANWVKVNFGLNKATLAQHKGKMVLHYDEFVGSLIDEGLQLEKSVWIKPTYGNKNLLWTYDDNQVGYQNYRNLVEPQTERFPASQIKVGNIELDHKKWQYSGYFLKNTTPIYTAVTYYCDGKTQDIAVFFWGEGNTNFADDPSVRELLTHLNLVCK